MEGKKISFGFMKTKKLERLPMQEKKDYIECVEEKSIKVVGGDEVKEIAPLVIPMKPNTLITAERLKEIAEKVEGTLLEPEPESTSPKSKETAPENETLEQMAVRELLEDSKKEVKVDTSQLTLSLPPKSVSSGEKESTLDDYESVPIQDFGLAMLRGMGWTKTNEKSTYKPPQLRPKGLGLGADKVVKDKQKVVKNSRDEELTIVKNAYVKITSGKFSGHYGKVLSLDEDNGRVMVDITVKKETVSLSEFMMHPVTKSEFDKESKVINANSFDQYKKNESQKSTKNSDKDLRGSERNSDEKPKPEQEGNSSKDNNNHRRNNEKQSENKDRKERSRDRSNREKYRDSSREKHKKTSKRDSSHDSLSDSDSEKNREKERKIKKQYSSMESLDSDTDRRNKRSEKERRRRDSDSESEKRSRNKEKKRHESYAKKKKDRHRNDSDLETDRKSKKSEKSKRYSSNSESDDRRSKRDETPEGKRDIDKKRKGKKKKRDRDRSPNYRKHRK